MPYTDKPQEVLRGISPQSKPYPIYVLMGEEEYFTDRIEQKILRTYMPDEGERELNYNLLYGMDTSAGEIVAACRRIPLGAERTITVVREAQNLMRGTGEGGGKQPLDALVQLTTDPVPFNILVLSFKGRSPSRRSKIIKEIESVGLVVASLAVREYNLESYIMPLAQEQGLMLSMDAVRTIREHIGTDIGRMSSELEKLAMALTPQERESVTADQVLKYTGLNKEYSPFDLRRALAAKDGARAMAIAVSLANDAKRVPVQVIIPVLFSYFSNLLIAFYARSNRPQDVMRYMGLPKEYLVRDYMTGLANYRAGKVVTILTYLRQMDARSKGMYSDEGDPDAILVDLVLMILN